MSKITAEHLQRNACVYVRQSTPDQLVHNLESQRRQYGLADRAKQLGWTTVEIIDDDLGRSGGGIARPGFERLLAAGRTGLVGEVRICVPLSAVSVFDSDRRKPRSASTSARIERRIWSGKCGSAPISKRDAAGSVIHAGKLANEPSGWSTTTNSKPPLSSRRLICTTSPKRGWNR